LTSRAVSWCLGRLVAFLEVATTEVARFCVGAAFFSLGGSTIVRARIRGEISSRHARSSRTAGRYTGLDREMSGNRPLPKGSRAPLAGAESNPAHCRTPPGCRKRVNLVGGPVRDGIVGRPGGRRPGDRRDIDLTPDATPDEIEALFAVSAMPYGTRERGSGQLA